MQHKGQAHDWRRKEIVRRSVLDRIFKEMQNIRYRLDDIETNFSNWNPQPMEVTETELLSLPDHLRTSYLIVATKGECNATTVSNRSGRCRAIESNYLNQLVRMGYLSRRRVSKAIHFRLIAQKEPCETAMATMRKSKT